MPKMTKILTKIFFTKKTLTQIFSQILTLTILKKTHFLTQKTISHGSQSESYYDYSNWFNSMTWRTSSHGGDGIFFQIFFVFRLEFELNSIKKHVSNWNINF